MVRGACRCAMLWLCSGALWKVLKSWVYIMWWPAPWDDVWVLSYKMYLCCSNLSHSFCSVYMYTTPCPSCCEMSWAKSVCIVTTLLILMFVYTCCVGVCQVKHISWTSLACWCIFFSSLIFFSYPYYIFSTFLCAVAMKRS
jgi:hypothetical protein